MNEYKVAFRITMWLGFTFSMVRMFTLSTPEWAQPFPWPLPMLALAAITIFLAVSAEVDGK